MQNSIGCFPFFLTNAISTLVFGEMARKNQAQIAEDNIEFRERMESIKNAFHEERKSEQLAFRRESYELSRQYLMNQTRLASKSRRKQTEFMDFMTNNYWPLGSSVYATLVEKEHQLNSASIIPLNVLIAWTDISSYNTGKMAKSYQDFCHTVTEGLNGLHNVNIKQAPWKKRCLSCAGDAMNINYILQGSPTLLVFPYYLDDTFHIEMAAWSFNQGPLTMKQDKILHIKNLKSDKELLDTAQSAVKACIGMARDSYMLSEYRAPLVYNRMIDDRTLSNPIIKEELTRFYTLIENNIKNDHSFKELCTDTEWDAILTSFNTPKLITA